MYTVIPIPSLILYICLLAAHHARALARLLLLLYVSKALAKVSCLTHVNQDSDCQILWDSEGHTTSEGAGIKTSYLALRPITSRVFPCRVLKGVSTVQQPPAI